MISIVISYRFHRLDTLGVKEGMHGLYYVHTIIMYSMNEKEKKVSQILEQGAKTVKTNFNPLINPLTDDFPEGFPCYK